MSHLHFLSMSFFSWQGTLGGGLLLRFSIQRSDFAAWPRWFSRRWGEIIRNQSRTSIKKVFQTRPINPNTSQKTMVFHGFAMGFPVIFLRGTTSARAAGSCAWRIPPSGSLRGCSLGCSDRYTQFAGEENSD